MLQASSNSSGAVALPTNTVLAPLNSSYHAANTLTTLQPTTVANPGGSQAHLNMQPFLTLTFCIALQGVFPPRS